MKHIGLIGYGGMGKYHTQQIASMPEDFSIEAVYDINKEKLEKACADGLKTYDTLQEILADKIIDTVIIATPNNFHKELSISCLKAGKHVICEKPVMMNSAELSEVLKASEECGKIFSAHQNRRWDKDFNIIRNIFKQDTIGDAYYIESRVQGAKGIPGDWRCTKVAGGGMLYDWGVHLIDQLMWLINSPVKTVYCQMLNVNYPEVDDNFRLSLTFENGAEGFCEVSTNTFVSLPRWHVSGKNGTAQINDWDCNGKIIRAASTEVFFDEGIVYTAAGPTRTMAPRAEHTVETLPLPQVKTDATDFYRNFHNASLGKESQIVTPAQMLKVMQVIDAAFESARLGTSIKLK